MRIPQLQGVLIDTYFTQRNRLGRLHTFLTRAIADGLAAPVTGLGTGASRRSSAPAGSTSLALTTSLYVPKPTFHSQMLDLP